MRTRSATSILPVLIYACALISGAANGAYAARDLDPRIALLLMDLALTSAFYCWLQTEPDKPQDPGWDSGFIVAIAWPLLVPYYLVRTRGFKRAALLACAFVGCYVAGSVAALAVVPLWGP